MSKQPEKIVPRNVNFADWYTSLIEAAKLSLYTPIKGEIIFQPKAWAIWTSIQKRLDSLFAKLGISNVALPTFIKYSDFVKEAKHVQGFAPEVFMVTKKGSEELTEPYVVRPTSEILFCHYFKTILKSYNDLPIKLNQWCNIFRAEKTTRPFLRTTEFFWQELHTIHETKQEALEMAQKELECYYYLATKYLLIPVIKGEKTPNERFAGAENTYTIEAIMQDGQALQCGTSHYLGQNFAKTYELEFRARDNTVAVPYQTSAGVSTRLIGAIIMSHSDDAGLVLPFDIADEQIAILEVFADKDKKVHETALSLHKALTKKGYRVVIDDSDRSFGYKINEKEVSGVPFCIIIGPKDVAENKAMLYRRDTREKKEVSLITLIPSFRNIVRNYQSNLYKRAKENLESRTVKLDSFDQYTQALEQGKLILAPWGGNEQDEIELKKLTGSTPRAIKSEINGKDIKCFFTKKKATHWVYFARAY